MTPAFLRPTGFFPPGTVPRLLQGRASGRRQPRLCNQRLHCRFGVKALAVSKLIYQVLLWLALPFILLRLWWRGRREPGYREGLGARFGRPPPDAPAHSVWFHAVSAGETIAVAPIVRALAAEHPTVPFLITTMTPTGAAEARRRLDGAAAHCYAPYDFAFAVRGFLDQVQPKLLVLMETELWPNLIDAARRRGIPVVLVNARLSERSARAYRRFPATTRTLLRQVALIACQYPDQAKRFVALGADPAAMRSLGSVKFDAVLPPDHAPAVARLRQELHLQGRRIWIAASTHPGEDEIVLDAHRKVLERSPNACLLLVPRHPLRAAAIKVLAERRRLRVALIKGGDKEAVLPPSTAERRRAASPQASAGEFTAPLIAGGAEQSADSTVAPEVLVVGAMGLLQTLYGLSEVAFIGGSLVPKGGHNPIEAALCAQPVLVGPAVFNFAEVAAAFAAAGCLTTVTGASNLAQAVLANFADEDIRQAAGQRALQVVTANSGATERLLSLLRGRLEGIAEKS